MTDDPATGDAMASRLRIALDLCEMGESMRRMQLRRERPSASDEEIEALLVAWLETRPGAEEGDAWGRVGPTAGAPSPEGASLENSRRMKEKSHRASPECYRSGVETFLGTPTRRLDGYSLYSASHV
ncbi:MAG TPA: hypothetical protein VML54_07585, partial [Candidatus Limnocylindrales bacterium]|nr:hypothetical protein [Candidatus Limnocylindrales bacterium]